MLLIILATLVSSGSYQRVAFALTTVQPAVNVQASVAAAVSAEDTTVESAIDVVTTVK